MVNRQIPKAALYSSSHLVEFVTSLYNNRTMESMIKRLRQTLKWAARRWMLALLLMTLLVTLAYEGPPPGEMETRINRSLAGQQFDFVGWEFQAMWRKLTHRLVAPQRYMDETARHDFLLAYLQMVAEAQILNWEIRSLYTDPDIEAPDEASAELRAKRTQLRADIRARQPVAEAILQEQVACVLVDEGFGVLGQDIPPVVVHITPLPQLLIVSPRDRIERIHSLGLEHGLDTAQKEAIEEQVDTTHDVSSLVTNIGGLSAYPSMLLESSSINWLTEVTAHEWVHHYLMPRPLGWNYSSGPETRTINETVASLMGQEVGRKVVARYYPEHLPPEPDPEPEAEEAETEDETEEPPAFDFRAEMRKTRVRVDELLAAGKIEQAEAYMEQRREVFVEEGYPIRKLNQAYFAFHGAYADQPGGAAGEDPIGPAVRELFARSPDLHTFLNRVAGVTTLEGVEQLLAEVENS